MVATDKDKGMVESVVTSQKRSWVITTFSTIPLYMPMAAIVLMECFI